MQLGANRECNIEEPCEGNLHAGFCEGARNCKFKFNKI